MAYTTVFPIDPDIQEAAEIFDRCCLENGPKNYLKESLWPSSVRSGGINCKKRGSLISRRRIWTISPGASRKQEKNGYQHNAVALPAANKQI